MFTLNVTVNALWTTSLSYTLKKCILMPLPIRFQCTLSLPPERGQRKGALGTNGLKHSRNSF